MNKFRNNLHSALFNKESVGEVQTSQTSIDLKIETELVVPTKIELNEVKKPLNQIEQKINGAMSEFDSEYFNFSNTVGMEVQQSRTDRGTLTNDQLNRVRNRHKEYSLKWNENVKQWYRHLLEALAKKGYFLQPKAKTTKEIQKKYMDEVSKQYENYVWDAKDEVFNNVKENLFTEHMRDSYPANIVYKNLTWALSIFSTNRKFTQWRGVHVIDSTKESDNWVGRDLEVETASDKENKDFLSKELPRYLRRIRNNPKLLENFNLGLVSKSTDRPSREDVAAIKNFLEAWTKVEVSGDKDPVLVLLEAFRDNRFNTDTTQELFKEILESHGITLKKDKYLKDIMNAWNFYLSTQAENLSERDQHAIYLGVLRVIEDAWWPANAVSRLKPVVEQAKAEAKLEKEQKFASWEKLQAENPELYKLAQSLWIQDFTYATRLALRAKHNPGYFVKAGVGEIVANVNNDKNIDGRDVVVWWLKSGWQFLDIYNQIWEEKALPKLLERAKTQNDILNLWLDTSIFTKKAIQSGNAEVILLLQDIISKPGEDLFTLLWGVEWGNTWLIEKRDLNQIEKDWKIREEAFNEAWKILNEKAFLENYKELFKWKDNVNIENFADLQASLASYLYDNYKLWLWAGSTLSFNDWAKWLQIWAGGQVRWDWAVLWLNISYSTSQDLGKWWTMTEALSAWIFLPIISWKADVFASVWLNVSADKKSISMDTWTAHHYWIDAWYNIITNTAYLWWHDRWNKLEWIPEAARFQAEKFEMWVMRKMLDNIKSGLAEIGENRMNLGNDKVNKKVREVISKMVSEQSDIPEVEKESVINWMLMRLVSYDNADLNQPWVKYAIAEQVAAQYEQTWAERRKEDISKWAYFSWYSIWTFWVIWTPKFWAYATAEITRHRIDGAWDKWGNTYESDSETISEWTQDALDGLNQELWLYWNNALKIDNWFVVIPSSLRHRVNVNEIMKWLMKEDENGNILIDVHTPMSSDKAEWGMTQWSEIRIWWNKWKTWTKLDLADWLRFAQWDIDQNKVLELGESVNTYDVNMLNGALDALKKKFPAWDSIQKFEFTNAEELINKLNALDKWKIAKLLITKNNAWELVVNEPVEWEEWRGLEIEYQARFEMMDSKAKEIADAVYAEALKVKDPRALNAVKHQPWAEYEAFKEAMKRDVKAGKEPDYKVARDAIKPIFAKLDQQIKGANFTEIGNELDAITDYNALWQALMSINNIFARSKKVRWWGENYEFKWRNKSWKEVPISMGRIIAEREGQISKTIKNYNGENITWDVKDSYQSLIEASAKYRKESKTFDSITSANAASLKNTVWFNLWDKTNPENPLFNPEIYNPMVEMKDLEKYGFGAEQRNALQKHAMKLFAGNEVLRNPILKYLWLDGRKVDIGDFVMMDEKWKLTLDISKQNDITGEREKKRVTLSAWMEFGYFTQCVNHTVILNDIEIETEDGSSVQFNSDVWENGTYREWSVSRILSTTKVNVGLAIAAWWKKEESGEVKSDRNDDWWKSPNTNPSDTTEDPTTTTTTADPWTTTDSGNNEV